MEVVYKFIGLNILLPFCLSSVYCSQIPFFRKDYTYIKETDAFYKLHIDHERLSWNSAFLSCDDEGATMFYPKELNELKYINLNTITGNRDHNITEIIVGLHDKFNIGEFITVDGHSIESAPSTKELAGPQRFQSGNCVLMNINKGSYRVGPCTSESVHNMAYVCKKVASDEICPTIDIEYKYVKSTRKCYKINRRHKTWDEAMRTCYMEGGLLTVIQNEREAEELKMLLGSKSEIYHVGFRRIEHDNKYYTVTGLQFETMYQRFKSRNNDEQDDQDSQQGADCGTVHIDGSTVYTSSIDCHEKRPFICEMDKKNKNKNI